ncbi:hypothetical protein [Pseudomonas sp. NPDC089401]|uniref:hypothetical protein n=1 Tax=Pseudomonas sp. NPDC089401 TaxID=3364462 RepID=UPI003813032E
MMLNAIILIVRCVLVSPAVAIYVLFVVLGLISGEVKDVYELVCYVFLASGLVPLTCWVLLVFKANRETWVKLSICFVGVFAYHYFLVVVGAHADFRIYAWMQVAELFMLYFAIPYSESRFSLVR